MRSHRLGLAAALTLGLLCGCGTSSPTPVKLTGKVTYKGQPLKAGNLRFYTKNGAYNTSIAEDGTYQIVDLPAGEASVTVDTEFLNPAPQAPDYSVTAKGVSAASKIKAPARPPAKMDKLAAERIATEKAAGFGPPPAEVLAARYTKIPAKYAKADTTPLSATLEAGKHELNFDLTD